MPKNDWEENNVETIFSKENLYPKGEIKSVLDVACGLSLKSQYINAEIRVGVDIYRPYLEKIETNVPHAIINADVMKLSELFLPKSFDLVLLLDIIEHLEKKQAIKLLEMAEDIASKAVIVETPKGFVPQNIDIWGYDGHSYQTHRCGWKPFEFTNKGYKVLLRNYKMCDVKRHTEIDVSPDIVFIDAIKCFS